jgi:probable phosphoglycerate mutase
VSGRRLILLRHGRTAWNDTGRAQGHADVELDAVGQEQAAAAAPYLSSLQPAALWSSDLTRARQTCAPLEQATGLAAKYDARLREFDVGARQGMTFAEFEQRFPAEFASWVRGDDTARVPGAEVASDVEERVVPALREALETLRDGETGIVVMHGACIKVALLALLGWPAPAYATIHGMDNCGWTTLEEYDAIGGLRLVGYNESVRPGHHAPAGRPDDV